jgi:hypothetical protein
MSHPDEEVLSRDEVAQLLGYSNPRTLSNRITKRLPVPPWSKPPGCKHRYWLRSDVIAFLRDHQI